MELLVTYDVDTTTPEGRRRLRRVARLCEKYGQRVQQSVFEVVIEETEYVHFAASLEDLITEEDNLRIYTLHKGTPCLRNGTEEEHSYPRRRPVDPMRTATDAGIPHRFPLQLRSFPRCRGTNSTPQRSSTMKSLVTKDAPLLNGGVGVSTSSNGSGWSRRAACTPPQRRGGSLNNPVCRRDGQECTPPQRRGGSLNSSGPRARTPTSACTPPQRRGGSLNAWYRVSASPTSARCTPPQRRGGSLNAFSSVR